MGPNPLLRLVGRFRRNRPYRVDENCVIRLDRLDRSPSMLKRPLVIIPPGLSTNPTHRLSGRLVSPMMRQDEWRTQLVDLAIAEMVEPHQWN